MQDGKQQVCWATPLYQFLRQCNRSNLHRRVLDCGAGGGEPPLALFHRYGYETYGVELDLKPLDRASTYCRKKAVALNILRGDMRCIPFASEAFSFVYSYNAIFFMTKPDIARTMSEIERVLAPGGLCYVNFVSVDQPDAGPFRQDAPLIQLLESERFAQHKDDEPETYFRNFEIVRKEKRFIRRRFENQTIEQVHLEYIARKLSYSGSTQQTDQTEKGV